MYHYHCASFRGSRLSCSETDYPYDLLLFLELHPMLSGIARPLLIQNRHLSKQTYTVSILYLYESLLAAQFSLIPGALLGTLLSIARDELRGAPWYECFSKSSKVDPRCRKTSVSNLVTAQGTLTEKPCRNFASVTHNQTSIVYTRASTRRCSGALLIFFICSAMGVVTGGRGNFTGTARFLHRHRGENASGCVPETSLRTNLEV